MGKEVKIGLAVIGVLLCVFGGVLFFRLRREGPTAQKKVAAKKDVKTKSDKKGGAKPEKKDDDGNGRSAAQTAWSTPRNARNERREADPNRAPSLEGSPYRGDRSDVARRQRYQDAAADENPAGNEPVSAEDEPDRGGDGFAARDGADADGADRDAGETVLTMPDRQLVRQSGDVSFDEDDQGEGADDSLDQRSDEGARELSLGRAADGAADRSSRYGRVEREPEESSEPETEQSAPQLVDDESEVRSPGANRYANRRYEDQLDGDQVDGDQPKRDQLGGGLGRDRFTQETAQDRRAMADDEETETSQAADEAPRPFRQRPETDSYVVEPNDNFWRISQKVYGTGAYFKALEEHNRRQYGDRRLINVGDVVSVPPLTALRENYADLCPKPRNAPVDRQALLTSSSTRVGRGTRTYTVAEGDTLFDIARQELGKASRWAEIYQLNRDQLGEDFNYLSPGMQLVLPERSKETDPIASRPGREAYRR